MIEDKTTKLVILSVIFLFLHFDVISCASAPKHIALSNSQLPELIPLRHFVAISMPILTTGFRRMAKSLPGSP